MILTRRSFLSLIGAALAAGAIVPAMVERRKPYVAFGEVVSWVGHCPSQDAFIGGKLVRAMGEWDGVGYPVRLEDDAFGRPARPVYDFDLCAFGREIPKHFWHEPAKRERYPNVHTWLREQRFGESVADAMRHLNFVGLRPA
jgi:hypothetical protein